MNGGPEPPRTTVQSVRSQQNVATFHKPAILFTVLKPTVFEKEGGEKRGSCGNTTKE
jgi:hypothetical protein